MIHFLNVKLRQLSAVLRHAYTRTNIFTYAYVCVYVSSYHVAAAVAHAAA